MMTDSCLNLRPHPSYFSAVTSAFHSAHDTSMEEAFPSRFLPRPLMISELEAVNTVLDPKLLVTPERRPPSLVQLHHPSPEDDQFYHRTTRVHFDQNVSVHHILPECANSSESTDDGSCNRMDSTDCVACPELDLTTLSDSEPISVVASDLRNLSVPLRSGFSASNKSSIKKFSCTTSSVDDKRGKFNANDKSRQVIGGTQRTESHKCADNAKQKLDISLPKSDGARGSPLESYGHQNAMVKRSFSSPMVVPETGSTDGLSLADAVMLTSPPSEPGLQCVLAKPELNTTLKMNREIEQIKQQEFDLPAVVKEKINPKLKAKVLEKASAKLNANVTMFPDLIGLEVSESDLLNQRGDEPLSRIKTFDKEKAEDKISRTPDVMDFFTSDLHKESASVSVVALPPLRFEPRTADLDRAFDLYRHIRTWEKM